MLFTKKTLWVPTLWGWLLLSALGIGIGTMLVRHAYPFLAPHAPANAKLLVVEGWMDPAELDQAVAFFRAGGYRRVITTGGPVPVSLSRQAKTSFAVLARDHFVQRGLPADSVTAVAAPASARDRTYLSAVSVREWLGRSGESIRAIDIVSEGAHSRRTRLLYRIAFGDAVDIGILPAIPQHFDPAAWWRSSTGTKTVLTEAIAWLWTVLFFDPGPHGSHEEMWAIQPLRNTIAPLQQ